MKNDSHISNANCLRETLGYSIRLDGKVICVVIDAEPFEDYDYTQLAQDFLLLKQSCDVGIIVLIGCFPTRPKKKKREDNLQRISHVSDELARNFVGSGKQIVMIKEGEQLSTISLLAILEKQPIVMVASENAHHADSSDIWRTISSVSNYLGKSEIVKLIIISNHDGMFGDHNEFLAQIHSGEIKELIGRKTITGELVFIAQTAIRAIEELGIKRVHLINGTKPDSLFVELFTKDGSGTMIYSGEYIDIRQAVLNDVGGMHALMSYYSEYEACLHWQLENIEEFLVAAIDEYIVAYARLQFFSEEKISLLTSLAVNPVYVEIGRKLLEKAVDVSRSQESSILFLVTPLVVPWWMPPDFEDGNVAQMPKELQKKYTGKKSVTLLTKKLS